MTKKNVQWTSGGVSVAGHLYLPDGSGPFPGIVMCHGFAGVKEMLLPGYAHYFRDAGFAVLTFDYRGFGESGGERGRLAIDMQLEDIAAAIGFLTSCPEIDSRRVGLWGTSLGGANAVVAASQDDRVRCLAVQLAFGSGERVVTGAMTEEDKGKFLCGLERMAEKREKTGKELMVPLKKVLTDAQSTQFYETHVDAFPALQIKVPFLTVLETLRHEPERALPSLRVPILVVGAGRDAVNPPDESRALFAAANEPKELLMLEEATHYDLYEGSYFDRASAKQLEWFQRHL